LKHLLKALFFKDTFHFRPIHHVKLAGLDQFGAKAICHQDAGRRIYADGVKIHHSHWNARSGLAVQ